MITLDLTLNELWACRGYVRQHDKHGLEWDRGYDRKIMAALLAAQAADKRAPVVFELEELWRTHRQVPDHLMTGQEPTGRNLLLKVMAAIAALEAATEPPTEEAEEHTTAVPPGVVAAAVEALERLDRIYPAQEEATS